jgi:hypothetical protein
MAGGYAPGADPVGRPGKRGKFDGRVTDYAWIWRHSLAIALGERYYNAVTKFTRYVLNLEGYTQLFAHGARVPVGMASGGQKHPGDVKTAL